MKTITLICLSAILVICWEQFQTTATDHKDCTRNCEQSRMSHHEAGIKNRAMKGHSYKTVNVKRIYDCHMKCFEEKCLCRAFQMIQTRCELLYEDRFSAPGDFQLTDGYVYYDMDREYVQQGSEESTCSNQCCTSSSCLNGGLCTEQCDDVRVKFICTCLPEFHGKNCSEMVKSCKEIFINTQGKALSGVYRLKDSTQNVYQTFCDFTTENNFVWTLIESFSFQNKAEFMDKPFFKSYPVNEQAFTWNRYRLSLSRINQTTDHSTRFRATCNFAKDELSYTDYMRGILGHRSVLLKRFDACKLLKYINVRGHNCRNCSALFVQSHDMHAHIDSYRGENRGCNFSTILASAAGRGSTESPGSDSAEESFGRYNESNSEHKCSARENATTQWWLGELKK